MDPFATLGIPRRYDLELTAVENLQRVPLSPLEEARAFQALADAGHSTRGIAKALGVATRRVTERLAILELSDADLLRLFGYSQPSDTSPEL